MLEDPSSDLRILLQCEKRSASPTTQQSTTLQAWSWYSSTYTTVSCTIPCPIISHVCANNFLLCFFILMTFFGADRMCHSHVHAQRSTVWLRSSILLNTHCLQIHSYIILIKHTLNLLRLVKLQGTLFTEIWSLRTSWSIRTGASRCVTSDSPRLSSPEQSEQQPVAWMCLCVCLYNHTYTHSMSFIPYVTFCFSFCATGHGRFAAHPSTSRLRSSSTRCFMLCTRAWMCTVCGCMSLAYMYMYMYVCIYIYIYTYYIFIHVFMHAYLALAQMHMHHQGLSTNWLEDYHDSCVYVLLSFVSWLSFSSTKTQFLWIFVRMLTLTTNLELVHFGSGFELVFLVEGK